MEIVAHSLSAAAAAIVVKRRWAPGVSIGWTAFWSAFPDILAFGPGIVAGLWLRISGSGQEAAEGHLLPHVHVGLPLYPFAHSLIMFLVVFGLASILTRRVVLAMLGWLLHIAIDIPTHSFSYYATRFLWPVTNYSIDGIAWWTPWFWAATYVVLAVVYLVLWKTGRMRSARGVSARQEDRTAERGPQLGRACPPPPA